MKSVNEISDLFAKLHEIQEDFNGRSEFGKDFVHEKLSFSFQNTFSCWGDTLGNQAKSLTDIVIPFLDSTRAELEVQRDVGSCSDGVDGQNQKHPVFRILQKQDGT